MQRYKKSYVSHYKYMKTKIAIEKKKRWEYKRKDGNGEMETVGSQRAIIDIDFQRSSRRVSIVERLMANAVNRIIPQRKSTDWNGNINSGESRIVQFDISLIDRMEIF